MWLAGWLVGWLERNLPWFARIVIYPTWLAGLLVGWLERNLHNCGRNVIYPTLLWLAGWLAGWLVGWLAGLLVGWLERNLLNFGRNVLGGCNFGGGLRPSPYSTLLLVFAAQTHEATIFISKNGSTAHTFSNKIKKSDASRAHTHDLRHHEKHCKTLIKR